MDAKRFLGDLRLQNIFGNHIVEIVIKFSNYLSMVAWHQREEDLRISSLYPQYHHRKTPT
jgi:hypothetical protein